MLTLWGRPTSGNVKKILWTLDELAVDYNLIKVGGVYGGLDNPDFLKLNPNALIPVIKDDDFILWESNTIVRYLVTRYGKDILWIEDCQKRASAEKWMDWTSNTIYRPFQEILFHSVRLEPEKRDPSILDQGIIAFENGLNIIEQALTRQAWLSGENFGVGDIIAGTFVYYYYGIDIKRHKKFSMVEDWYQRLQQRPAYVRHVMIPIS